MTKNNYLTAKPLNRSTEVAIIGGGMVGLAQGIALAQAGLDVVVIDREDPATILQAEFDGRTSAVAWKSVKFLEGIGVWKNIEPHAQPINDIRVSDGNSLLFTHFDHSEIGDEPFGYIVENRHTRIALYERAKQLQSLSLLAPSEVGELVLGDRKIFLKSSPSPITYSLLIAADGKNSATRAAAGIAVDRRDYRQSGIVCTIAHELPHNGLAHEKFLPAGPFAVLPLKDREEGIGYGELKKSHHPSPIPHHLSSLVWTEPTDLVPIFMAMSDAEFLAEIEKRCDYLGKISLVNVGSKNRWAYPLVLTHARSYTGDALVLVGDAAHAIHPIAGQGVNLGFRDVIDLTALILAKRKLGLPLSSVLAEYEQKRRLDNSLMIFATDSLNRLFSNNITPIRLARDLGLGLVNEIAPLKKFFMKAASGKF